MRSLLSDARVVYRSEGGTSLVTKGVKTALAPIIGEKRARIVYHNFNRMLMYRSFDAPTFDFPHNLIGIRDDGYHTFFGFYDHTPFCPENRRVLYTRTQDPIRPVTSSDTLELCYYDLETHSSTKFGETATWNWQKGCRLMWYPDGQDTVLYNKLVDGSYGAVIQNVSTGDILKRISSPVYDIGPNGRYAASINYSRLERLRPDYGYSNLPDDTSDQPVPTDDGIFLVDLKSGTRNLIISFEEMRTLTGSPPGLDNYVMNILFSPSGEHFCFLYRYVQNGSVTTYLLCSSIDGQDVRVLQSTAEASHPTWLSDSKLLCTVNHWDERRETDLILYDLEAEIQETVAQNAISEDTHPSLSPDSDHIFIGDTYPDPCGNRHLFVHSLRSDRKLLCTVNHWDERRETDLILYDLEAEIEKTVAQNAISEDTHPSLLPDSDHIFIGDTYPDPCGNRHLFVHSLRSDRKLHVGSVYGPVREIKRDLHPRWDRDGKYVCIDTPQPRNGQSISIINVEQAVSKLLAEA